MNCTAVPPSPEYKQAFLAMLADFDANDPENGEFYSEAKTDFSAYLQRLSDDEQGRNLPDGFVPCTHRWLLSQAGTVVGVTRLRHNIDTKFLAECAGHIGYDVSPSQRGCGYGHLALRAALREARSIGLPRALLFAGEGNSASRAVIERAGGALESITFSEFWGEQLCRYWVNVPNAG